MPIQVYKCPKHGKFERTFPLTNVPKTHPCPICHKKVDWVPSLPAYIHVEGGTGAGKSSHTR
ncbi:hypothetical protein LCGC14_0294880 [marine sediment metagenome]|uniref:Putative regulatory protein FmdB zinc ribbon domain-containing protein n=1 Tax=marine sediment metagenome TaxID=412755 RepID=A0A0F9TS39_9ZZZZ